MNSANRIQRERIEAIRKSAEESIRAISGRRARLILHINDKKLPMHSPQAGDFIKYVCKKTGYRYAEICSRSRPRNLSHLRQAIGKILFQKTHLSSAAVGKILNRDHATILYGTKNNSALFKKTYGEVLKLYTAYIKEIYRS